MLEHSLTKLSNGMPVIRVPMPAAKSVTALVLTNTGSRYEEPREEGIAHFFEHIVFKGTQKYTTAQDLAAAIDSVGADFNAFTSKEYTGYYVKGASQHLGLALDVISDMLLRPLLRQEDIDREKGVIIEEINMYADNPARHIDDIFDRMMFKGSGLGHDIIGTKKTVSNIKTANFQQFLKQWYGYGNMLLILAGDATVLNAPETLEMVESAFSKDGGERIQDKVNLEAYLPPYALAPERFSLTFKETEQAHFVLGWPGITRTDDRRYAQSLLTAIMGGNMSSRLFSEVREKRGLCYYVHAGADTYHDVGEFGASAGVDPKRVEEALKVTIGEFEAAAHGKRQITQEEVQKAKDYIAGKLALGIEDSEDVAQYFGMRQLLTNEIESPDEALAKIRAVTVDEVQQLLEDILQPNELRLALIGPFKDQQPFDEIMKQANPGIAV